MENKTKKIDIKTVVIVIVTIIAIVEGIVIFISKGTHGELKEKDVIGTWVNDTMTSFDGERIYHKEK